MCSSNRRLADGGASPARAPFHGSLELVFAPGLGGTVLAHARVTAPLKIVRPFPLDGGRALVQILTLGPGLCAGDRCTIEVSVEPGARAVVITQSASRVLSMPAGDDATQSVTLTVKAGGQLEYYPGLTIPFADSSFAQRVHARIAASSRLGILESWSTGRISRGEHLRFRRISSRTTIDVDGAPAYADALELEPTQANLAGMGILENYRYVASGCWHGASLDPEPAEPRSAHVMAAMGQTTPEQVYLRALAMDGYQLGEELQRAVQRINVGWGLEAIPLRRFTS
jgi:urease accessory protein